MCQTPTSAAGPLADETCSVKLRINEEWGFFVHSEVGQTLRDMPPLQNLSETGQPTCP